MKKKSFLAKLTGSREVSLLLHNSHTTLLVLGKFQLLDYSRNIC